MAAELSPKTDNPDENSPYNNYMMQKHKWKTCNESTDIKQIFTIYRIYYCFDVCGNHKLGIYS